MKDNIKCYKKCYWCRGKRKLYCNRFIVRIRIDKDTPIYACYEPIRQKEK